MIRCLASVFLLGFAADQSVAIVERLQTVGGCVLSAMVGASGLFSFLPFFARCGVVFAWLGYLLGFGVFRAVWGYFKHILPLFSPGCLVAFVRVAVFSGIIAILAAFWGCSVYLFGFALFRYVLGYFLACFRIVP